MDNVIAIGIGIAIGIDHKANADIFDTDTDSDPEIKFQVRSRPKLMTLFRMSKCGIAALCLYYIMAEYLPSTFYGSLFDIRYSIAPPAIGGLADA